MPWPVAVRWHHDRHRRGSGYFRLVLVLRRMAAAAEIVGCAELNQQAAITANHFPVIYRGKSRGHLGLGVARAGLSWNQLSYLDSNLRRNLREIACGCQGKSGIKREESCAKSKMNRRKPGENRE